MKMYYHSADGIVEFKLVTDPDEALYWKNYKVKLSDIKIVTPCDRSTAASLRREILEDMKESSHEPKKVNSIKRLRERS